MPKIYVSDTWVPRDGLFDIRTISLPEVKALLGAFEVVNEIADADLSYRLVMHLGSVELPAPVTLDEMLFNLPADGLALLVSYDSMAGGWRFELVRQFDRDMVLSSVRSLLSYVQEDGWSVAGAEDFAARLGGAL